MKNTRRNQPSKSLKSVRNYCLMMLCGLIVIGGFFFAARQHFASMDYGMRNSKMRRQLDELEAEKRRLIFSREVSLSPAELKRSAKKTGLSENGIPTAPAPQLASLPAKMQVPTPVKASTHENERKPMVARTAAVYAVNQPVPAVYVKEQKIERTSRRSVQAE